MLQISPASPLLPFLTFGTAILLALPRSPFNLISSIVSDYPMLAWVNYFIPISEMVAIMQVWVAAYISVLAVIVFLRTAKIFS